MTAIRSNACHCEFRPAPCRGTGRSNLAREIRSGTPRIGACILLLISVPTSASAGIDRLSVAGRHCPSVRSFDPLSPFTVGNGDFAFTVDATGLQSFPAPYRNGIPLSTQSQWAWHSFPNPESHSLEQTLRFHQVDGRRVGYAAEQGSPAGQWLRANPHRLHLGRIGFRILREDGSVADTTGMTNIRQTLDLWQGIINSAFTASGVRVSVQTACHPQLDAVAARFRSGLLKDGRLAVEFEFPYGS
ncbi:hypothetical protein JW777_10910, partial [bacterium]|nr:hypothetical protein [bacterium]